MLLHTPSDGEWENFFSRDYKSPAAYTLTADEIMIESASFGSQDTQESFFPTWCRLE